MSEAFSLRSRADQDAEFGLLVIGVSHRPHLTQHFAIRA